MFGFLMKDRVSNDLTENIYFLIIFRINSIYHKTKYHSFIHLTLLFPEHSRTNKHTFCVLCSAYSQAKILKKGVRCLIFFRNLLIFFIHLFISLSSQSFPSIFHRDH